MKAVIYYSTIPFIYIISLLPFPVLYLLSDVVFCILYYGIGYRKKVVLTNLTNAFPDKGQDEIQRICKKYYRYLCDLLLETFKTLTISKEEMLKHCYFCKPAEQLMSKLADENRNLILVLGHLGNWEWGGNAFSIVCKQQLYVIYHPLENKYFDRLMYHMRTRFGAKLIGMKNAYKDMLGAKNQLNATAFIADQTPSNTQGAYWTTFLNQDTPVFKGTEVIARKLNYPVVYINVKKVKRGYYEMNAELLVAEPDATTEGQISELHTKKLENDIKKQPETWLWSHRRWKHKRVVV